MAQEFTTEQVDGQSQRRGRGPTKPFPSMSFEDTLSLSRSILEYGVNGEIQRLTLFSKIDVSPNSSKTRELISSSFKYGLTTGSYNAPSLSVTDDGRVLLSSSSSPRIIKEKQFELAIKQFDQFNNVYEKLKNRRLPDIAVLKDELGRVQVAESDRGKVAEIFTENLRFLGLVNDISGSAYVRAVEDVLEKVPKADDSAQLADRVLSSGYHNLSSLLGKLEEINVHRSPTATIWDRLSGAPVRWVFPREEMDRVKALLEKPVLVTGDIRYFSNGTPRSISNVIAIEDATLGQPLEKAGFGSIPDRQVQEMGAAEWLNIVRGMGQE